MTTEENQSESLKNYEEHRLQLGAMMKDLRLEKAHTRESLSKKTKIQIKTLVSLEEGNPSFFQERLYSRGFITLICKEFKVDPAPFLNKLDDCESPEQRENRDKIIPEPTSSDDSKKSFFARKSLFFSFFVLLLFTTSLLYQGYWSHEKKPPHTGQTNGESRLTKSKQPIEDCRKLNKKKKGSRDKTACVTVRVLEKTKFQTKEDGRLRREKPYEPGDYHFFYENKLQIHFEDASLVELMENGKKGGPLSGKKEAKTMSFSL